jgi:hypothetical protein
MFFRTIGSRRYGFTAASFVLMVKLYQLQRRCLMDELSWVAAIA